MKPWQARLQHMDLGTRRTVLNFAKGIGMAVKYGLVTAYMFIISETDG
jgi:hypothetical protein